MLKGVADNTSGTSLATTMRRRRFALLLSFLDAMRGRSLKLLDVGGTQEFWLMMCGGAPPNVQVTLLNLERPRVSQPGFEAVEGDARDLSRYADKSFDVVFSNSVIEHLGPNFENQMRMANEIRRAGKRYFVQTPNRYFPIEPHFLLPVFQFWPSSLRVWALTHFNIGWYKRFPDEDSARREVESISLLREAQVRRLFPEARIYREKLFRAHEIVRCLRRLRGCRCSAISDLTVRRLLPKDRCVRFAREEKYTTSPVVVAVANVHFAKAAVAQNVE